MCHYYRKAHTCGCHSKIHLNLCRTGILANAKCDPLTHPFEAPATHSSYFMCYDCIRKDAHLEAQAKHEAKMKEEQDRAKVEEARRMAEKEGKSEKVREEYRKKVEREKRE
ncbi:hypothetical protein K458DRAFT_254538, partial [Lentithecium fluviatile CBS 122367]